MPFHGSPLCSFPANILSKLTPNRETNQTQSSTSFEWDVVQGRSIMVQSKQIFAHIPALSPSNCVPLGDATLLLHLPFHLQNGHGNPYFIEVLQEFNKIYHVGKVLSLEASLLGALQRAAGVITVRLGPGQALRSREE